MQDQNRASCPEHPNWLERDPPPCSAQDDELALLREAGLTDWQLERLVLLRRRVLRGEVGGRLPEERRLGFLRWLIEQGKISDNNPNSNTRGGIA